MKTIMFSLDKSTHTYMLGDRILPGVTASMRMFNPYNGIDADVMEHARERGTLVDEAVNAFDSGTLDPETVDAEVVPYLLAWIGFKSDTKCEILESQLQGFNQVFGYAGTLDKIIAVPERGKWLIDIKATAKIEPTAALQTAAYCNLDNVRVQHPRMKRFTLQLMPDETYRLHQWQSTSDFGVFLAALTISNWNIGNR